jgi:hypothetical protein
MRILASVIAVGALATAWILAGSCSQDALDSRYTLMAICVVAGGATAVAVGSYLADRHNGRWIVVPAALAAGLAAGSATFVAAVWSWVGACST